MTKTMADIITAHLDMTGDEYDLRYIAAIRLLANHIERELTAAGFGLVADDKRRMELAALLAYEAVEEGALREAGAKALEEAADGWQAYIRAMDWGTTAPIHWLRARAAEMRQG